MPNDSNKYYLFTIGVTGNYGLYYSTIDMTQDSGRGAVVLKNIQLKNWSAVDGMSAIKHGNGRDWWVLVRPWDNTNSHYLYLISPLGITQQPIQLVGSLNTTNSGNYRFNSMGNKLAYINYKGLIELYDFDRCSGIISNPVTLETETTPIPGYWDCEFSPNGNLLYVVISQGTSYLLQYNLLAPNPTLTRDTIFTIAYPTYSGGLLKLAPDGKIYWSCSWYDGFNWNFPYPDTTFNAYITPYSFYLGGNRCYLGLPNNPDYDMPRLQGSTCDTVLWTNLTPGPSPRGEGSVLYTTYVSEWEKLFVNAQNIKGKNATLKVYDLNGRVVFSSFQKTQPPYFTQDVDVSNLSAGMYIVTFTTDTEILSTKFVKN